MKEEYPSVHRKINIDTLLLLYIHISILFRHLGPLSVECNSPYNSLYNEKKCGSKLDLML